MRVTESASIFLASAGFAGQSSPFRALEGFNSCPPEIGQPLQVVASRHHDHGEVGPCLADGAYQFAAHLLHCTEDMLHTGARLGNPLVAPLLAFRQRLVPLPLALDTVAVSGGVQFGLPLHTRVALVGEHVPVGIGRVEHRVEMLAVVGRGRVRLDLADHLVALVYIDGQLVAVVALAVFLGPGGVQILLPALGRFPVRRHGILLDLLFVFLAEVLLRGRNQSGVDDLAAARYIALLEQLLFHAVKQAFRPRFANPVLEGPDRGAVRYAGRIGQATETLVAHPIQQLVFHLFVREVVQPLEYQDADHRLARERRSASLRALRSRRISVHFRRQHRKVNVFSNLHQRIAQTVNLLLPLVRCKQVILDGASLFHHCRGPGWGSSDFTGGRGGEVFRGAP